MVEEIAMGSNAISSPEMQELNEALKRVMRVSKTGLNRLLAEDTITPLVPQKRGCEPKA